MLIGASRKRSRKQRYKTDAGNTERIAGFLLAAQSSIQLFENDGQPASADCEKNERGKDEEDWIVGTWPFRHPREQVDSYAGRDGLLPVAHLFSTPQKAVIQLRTGTCMTQEFTQLPIGLSFLATGVLLGAMSLLDRLLHGGPCPFRLVLGLGNSFI